MNANIQDTQGESKDEMQASDFEDSGPKWNKKDLVVHDYGHNTLPKKKLVPHSVHDKVVEDLVFKEMELIPITSYLKNGNFDVLEPCLKRTTRKIQDAHEGLKIEKLNSDEVSIHAHEKKEKENAQYVVVLKTGHKRLFMK